MKDFLELRCEAFEDREATSCGLVRDLTETVRVLQLKMKDPPPFTHFGDSGDEWDYDVAEIAFQLFGKRFNCAMVHAAFEVFLGALFPGQNVRVPSVKMCELWRWAMYDLSRFVVLKCMEKAKRYHGVTDESRKGGASLLASGLKGEFERNGETVVVDALLDLDFIANQDSVTEKNSFLNSLHIKLSDDPELQAKIDVLKVRSMASDHALGAQLTSKLVGVERVAKLAAMSAAEKAALSPFQRNLFENFDATTCQNHLLNLLTTAWVGKARPRAGDPDKAIAAHGENESAIQFQLIGATLLKWWWDMRGGKRCVRVEEDFDEDGALITSSLRGGGTTVTFVELSLLRWGWQKLQWRWHKCKKNAKPKPYNAEDVPAISEALCAAAKLFGHTGDFTSYYLNEGRILAAWARQNKTKQQALWKAFKSSRMNWNVECSGILLQNAGCCLPFLHQLRVCTQNRTSWF